VDKGVIKRFAKDYAKNPEAAVFKYQREMIALKQEFPDIGRSVLRRFLRPNPTNPKAAAIKIRKWYYENRES